MKYGNLSYKLPNLDEEVAAAKDLLNKGELTRPEYNKKISQLQQMRLKYIIATNGGYTPSKKLMNAKTTISETKTRSHAHSLRVQREKFLDEVRNSPKEPPVEDK